jgi:hypothetical protein
MTKQTNQSANPRVTKIFEDLERYLSFCREFGYRYDEADLYNSRSFAYKQFQRFEQGKNAKDMWAADSKVE